MTSRQILNYVDVYLEDWLTDIVAIYVSVDDVIRDKSLLKFANFTKNVVKIINKCREYGVKKVFFIQFLQQKPCYKFW